SDPWRRRVSKTWFADRRWRSRHPRQFLLPIPRQPKRHDHSSLEYAPPRHSFGPALPRRMQPSSTPASTSRDRRARTSSSHPRRFVTIAPQLFPPTTVLPATQRCRAPRLLPAAIRFRTTRRRNPQPPSAPIASTGKHL